MKIFGIEVSGRSIRLSLVHNAVEIITMVVWLDRVLAGQQGLGLAVLIVGLSVEHVLALAAGKVA